MKPEEIAGAVNKIIEEIPKSDRIFLGAINWGDLGCSQIREIREVWPYGDTDVSYEVTVEEADPSSYQLAAWIEFKMSEEHGISISVRLEW